MFLPQDPSTNAHLRDLGSEGGCEAPRQELRLLEALCRELVVGAEVGRGLLELWEGWRRAAAEAAACEGCVGARQYYDLG